jgi:hypothetical protein
MMSSFFFGFWVIVQFVSGSAGQLGLSAGDRKPHALGNG